MFERKQFTFYESFFSAISRIKDSSERAETYDAICAYALYGTLPDLDALPVASAIAFELIRPTLDTSRRKAKSGQAGGKSKQSVSKDEANSKQTASKQKAKSSEDEGEKEWENEIEIEKEIEVENECYTPKPPKGAKRFSPPSFDDVKSYCQERENGVDPQAFVDWYTSNGWKVGKNPMKDWKAAVRTWERKETNHGRNGIADSAVESQKFRDIGTDL